MFNVCALWRPRAVQRLRGLSAALLFAGILGANVPAPVAAAAASFTSTATLGAASIAPGSTETISAKFTSAAAMSNVNLDIEVRDASNTKVYQKLFWQQAFTAGQTQSYAATWAVPANQALGKYTVKIGAFSADFSTAYSWNDNAAPLSVSSGSAPPPPPAGKPGFTSTANVSAASVAPGTDATITANFTSATTLSNVNMDVEVRDASDTKVYQQLFWNQAFSAGQTQPYKATWSVPGGQAGGNYTVKLGAFSADFSTAYSWNDNAASLSVGTVSVPPTAPPTVTGTAYYVDCSGGNDSNNGTDTSRAWSTLSRANQATLNAGDGLLLKRGCAWTGPLVAAWNGSAAKPITIGAYGTGNRPLIQNANPYQVRVTGTHMLFDNLAVRSDPESVDPSCNNNRIGYREGFYLDTSSSYNIVQNSLIYELGGGIEIAAGSHHNSIRRNELSNNSMMYNKDQYANDGGATAIVMFGDDNDIGYNNIHDQHACSSRYGGVIGHAVDVEWGQNNVYHHNTATNNGSNFAELGGYDKSHTATNTTFAYNIVYNSGLTNHDNAKGTKLYNNIFYAPGAGIISCGACSPSSMTLKNNIFYAATGIYADGPVNESNNIFWNSGNSVYNTQGLSSTSKIVDPQLVNSPGSDFHLQNGSPAINAGSADSANAGFRLDFDGQTAPQGGAVDIGVYEMR